MTGPAVVTGSLNCGALTTSSISSAGNIAFTNLVESNIISKKSLVIGQTGDQNGDCYLTLQNRTGMNGALFQTTDATTPVVDFCLHDGQHRPTKSTFRRQGYIC